MADSGKDYGSYAYDIVVDLIDYCGDVRRNNARKDQAPTYSPDFSPNNIRRIVLSAEGVYLTLHVPYKGRKTFSKSLSSVSLGKGMMSEGYKPMIWALADRVCSSIEEIIICVNSESGLSLSSELNFDGLLSRHHYKGDIKSNIMQRFKRLAYFTVLNCTINELLSDKEVRGLSNDPYNLVSDTNFARSHIMNCTQMHEDWYKYYGSASVYDLDRKGSRLNTHFNEVKSGILEKKKSIEVAKLKKERTSTLTAEFDKEYFKYNGIFACTAILQKQIQKRGTNYLASDIQPLVLSTETYCLPSKYKEDFDKAKSTDEYNKIIKDIKVHTLLLYRDLCNWFLSGLSSIYKVEPLSVKIMSDALDKRIYVPKELSSLAEGIGLSLEGKKLPDSVANICTSACSFFLADDDLASLTNLRSKTNWISSFKKGVTK